MFPKTFRTSGNMGTWERVRDVRGVAADFQLAYDCPSSTLFVWVFFKMEYANDDTTGIPEIDLNISVAVQPYQLSRWTEIAVVSVIVIVIVTVIVIVIGPVPSQMKNVTDQVLKVVSKSSLNVKTRRSGNTTW